MPPIFERTGPQTLAITHSDIKAGWEQWYLLASDVHYDSTDCDRALFRHHMETARERDAHVFLLGDSIDGMQGRTDRRSSKSALDEDYKADDYIDRLVDETSDRWQPFADRIQVVSFGNHERSLLVHNETNVVRRLADNIGAEFMGFSGYLWFKFSGEGGRRTSRLLWFHHGSGGSAPVTRGTIKTNRRSVVQTAPDIIASGHLHQQWLMLTPMIRFSSSGKPYRATRYHVQLGTYADSYNVDDVPLDWGDEKEFDPPLIGAWWLKFRYNERFPGKIEINFELAQ